MQTTIKPSESGAAIIEFALISPILILILMGIIEYGLYFQKSQILQRAVSTTATAIQINPSAPNSRADAQNSGLGAFDLAASPNFICADSFATYEEASKGCAAGSWERSAPGNTSISGTYYVVVKAHIEYQNLTPIMKPFLPGNDNSTTADAIQVVAMTNGSSSGGAAGGSAWQPAPPTNHLRVKQASTMRCKTPPFLPVTGVNNRAIALRLEAAKEFP